ncbi:MAG: DNA cytosine methyltransferase, partial [Ruminococcus sp.]|nr:DNA cytosine methyltransferase [Ruminococcus sp.]
MNKPLTLGSLFSGSGTFEMAGILSGITPVWASEIEPFPIAVTQKRLPFMKHYGDISKLNGAELPPVDIITFGSPCTDLSVAGKRAGIQAERSGLFFEAIRIIKEMRCKTNGEYPKYIVWENVPGAFSSGGGEDFRCVLEEICKIADESAVIPKPAKWHNAGEILAGHYSVAYRLFDAQYWGVPQRRKRIYLVADFTGECAGKILFESEGVSRYSAESFRAWQRTAGGAADCIRKASGEICLNDQGGNRMDVTEDMTCTLRAEAHHPPCVLSAGFCTEHSAKARGIGYEEEKSPTLRAGIVPAALSCYENHSQDTRYRGPLEVAPTVSATYGSGGNNQPFVVNAPVTLKIRSGCEGGGKGAIWQEDKSATLSCNNDQTLFAPKAYGISAFESNAMKSD